MAVGGGSAERRAEELASSEDGAAAAWAAGAEGEHRVAEELANLREAWTVLHDRLLRPGQSEANLDHVVIGPGGMFLVDAKNRAGRVTVWEGGLFQHTLQAGDRVSLNLGAELKKVHGMAAYSPPRSPTEGSLTARDDLRAHTPALTRPTSRSPTTSGANNAQRDSADQ